MAWPTIAKPSLKTDTTVKDNSLSSTAVNGMRLSRAKYTRQLREWVLTWNALSDAQLVQVLTFYNLCRGGAASFTWTDEFNNNYTVRFLGAVKHYSVGENMSAVSLTLEEV